MKKLKHQKAPDRRNNNKGKKEKASSKIQHPKLEDLSCACGYDVMLPWWCPYLVTMATMVIRVNYVVSPRSWWILHPDEVYQTVEVAFSELTGYGFRSYEYLPAPTNTSVSMETQSLTSGMFALRSFVLPYIFMMSTIIARLAGFTCSTFMIGRVFNAMVTSTLPLCIYKLVNTINRCRLMALLACALTASSVHLAAFGTHPLVNSFTSPFIVIGLVLCFDIKPDVLDCERGTCVAQQRRRVGSDMNGNVLKTNQTFHYDSGPDAVELISHQTNCIVKGETDAMTMSYVRKSKVNGLKPNANDTEPLSCNSRYSTPASWLRVYTGGVVVGLVCYIRPDTVLFIALTYLPLGIVLESKRASKLLSFSFVLTGVISSVLLCTLDDFYRYGVYVCSPFQWFKFNVLSQKASLMFSREYANWYMDMALLDPIGVTMNICALSALILMTLIHSLRVFYNRTFCTLLLSHVLLLAIYSCVGHKEPRIIHNCFILQTIISAMTLHHFVVFLKRLGVKTSYLTHSLFIFVLLSAILSYRNFPSIDNKTAADWSYKDPEASRDVNNCLNYVRDQKDVQGVLVNASVYTFGGYSVMEQDVPLLARVHYEYHLYEAKYYNRLGSNNRIRVFTDFSDFIDIDNHPYVYELIRETNMNYIVTLTGHVMNHQTYDSVFTFGKYSVFRKNHQKVEKPKKEILPTIENASILEYEANWLITNSLYKKAIWRINNALNINRKLGEVSRVRLFQLLMVCYGKMNRWDMVKVYQDECFSIYGRDTCITQQDKITRHTEYSRFN